MGQLVAKTMRRVLSLLILGFFVWQFIAKFPDESVNLIVCDVGQGDAILIQRGLFQLLIDTGPDEAVLTCLNRYLPFMDKKIDVLILTHYDSDHIGGFANLAENYQFGTIFAPLSENKESELFLELNRVFFDLIGQGTRVKQPILGQQMAYQHFSLDNHADQLLFTFLTPTHLELDFLQSFNFFQAESRLPETILSAFNQENLANFEALESINDRSIALLLEYGQLRVFLSGDLEESGELSIINSALIDRVDILKVAHHGSKTSSTPTFLSQVLPELALVSVGRNNNFNHPSPEVLDNLQAFSAQIIRTDQSGDIKIVLLKDNYYFLTTK
jgi:competence protein ComEC